LAQRKGQELIEARRKLDAIIKRQVAIESNRNRSTGDNAAIIREKEAQLRAIDRLEGESSILESRVQAARPKPPLTPQQQFWADLRFTDPYEKAKRGTPEQIAEAQKAVDALVREYRSTSRQAMRCRLSMSD
jgi:hypothetical protein